MMPYELDMLIEKIRSHRCEMQNVEVKAAAKGTPERLYDTFSSFSNQTGGGILVFGLDEKNGFDPVGVYDAQELQAKVSSAALMMEPPVRPFFTVTECEGKSVLAAEIAECEPDLKPCFYRPAGRLRGSYIRVGDADMLMTEFEIYSYEVYRKKIRDELRPVERALMSDLDGDKSNAYVTGLRIRKPQLKKMDDEKILRLQGITDGKAPTVTGMMLLGEYPQGFFPQLSITAMAVDGIEMGELAENGARFIDDRRLEGTIPEMLEDALAFVRRNIRHSVIIDNDGKRADRDEYPLAAVRELILNALIHRDYSMHTEDSPIRVIIFRDRLVVENPGGLYGRLTIDDLGNVPGDTRNPFLAGNLEVMIDTENRFSGIPSVREEMKKAGLMPPVFESRRGMFRATLYNSERKEIETDVSIEDRILEFCNEPRSKEEIAAMLGIRTSYYVVTKYLRPMAMDGKLAMTIPEKPRSKFQRYYVN